MQFCRRRVSHAGLPMRKSRPAARLPDEILGRSAPASAGTWPWQAPPGPPAGRRRAAAQGARCSDRPRAPPRACARPPPPRAAPAPPTRGGARPSSRHPPVFSGPGEGGERRAGAGNDHRRNFSIYPTSARRSPRSPRPAPALARAPRSSDVVCGQPRCGPWAGRKAPVREGARSAPPSRPAAPLLSRSAPPKARRALPAAAAL